MVSWFHWDMALHFDSISGPQGVLDANVFTQASFIVLLRYSGSTALYFLPTRGHCRSTCIPVKKKMFEGGGRGQLLEIV